METVAQAVGNALHAIAAPATHRNINPNPSWDWQWHLTGAETTAELAKCAEMLRLGREFVADMARGHDPRWLVLVGPNGSGKSYLAERIAAWVREHGRGIYERERAKAGRADVDSLWSYAQEGPLFRRWQNLLNRLRQGEYHRLETDARDWFKVIDDLGVGAIGSDGEATGFAVQKMGELLDRRLRKWTVITTNFTRRQIAEQFDTRIASRLIRGGNVVCDCEHLRDYSIRREKASEQMAGVEVAA